MKKEKSHLNSSHEGTFVTTLLNYLPGFGFFGFFAIEIPSIKNNTFRMT
jgi:hypothetical protein